MPQLYRAGANHIALIPPPLYFLRHPQRDHRSSDMLDVVFIVVGAAFLYACVLYTYACDQL
jgi:hypothetical protein